jgi:hypothetical protein
MKSKESSVEIQSPSWEDNHEQHRQISFEVSSMMAAVDFPLCSCQLLGELKRVWYRCLAQQKTLPSEIAPQSTGTTSVYGRVICAPDLSHQDAARQFSSRLTMELSHPKVTLKATTWLQRHFLAYPTSKVWKSYIAFGGHSYLQ